MSTTRTSNHTQRGMRSNQLPNIWWNLFLQSVRKEPHLDKLPFAAVCLDWKWEAETIVELPKAIFETGQHPAVRTEASRVVICMPGKDDYTKLKLYRSISLLSCMGKVVAKVVTELLAEEAERRRLLSDGRDGSSQRRSAFDAMAIMVDGADTSWSKRHLAGVPLMDIKAAFPSIGRVRLIHAMRGQGMEADLIRWMASVLIERMMELVINCNILERHPVEACIPHGSLVSPILFAVYMSGLI